MAEESLHKEMTAVYSVNITGIQRTRSEMAKLDSVIRSLRSTQYGSAPVTTSAQASGDFAVALIDELEGRVQTKVQHDVLDSMRFGADLQAAALQAAITTTGTNRGHGNGPGRDDTGHMIEELTFNVEVLKTADETRVTGFHGWKEGHEKYIDYQEQGTKGKGGLAKFTARTFGSVYRKSDRGRSPNPHGGGVPAANSLGAAIVPVREALKTLIGRLR